MCPKDIRSRFVPSAITSMLIVAASWCADAPKNSVPVPWTEETRESLLDTVRTIGERGQWSCNDIGNVVVGQYGNRPETVQALLSLLKDTDESGKTKSVAAVALGQLGGAGARDGLIRFIEQPRTGTTPDEDFGAFEWAIKCLGVIGDEESKQFLIRLSSLAYWMSRTDRPKAEEYITRSATNPDLSPEKLTVTRLRDCALNGIVIIGTQEALDTLMVLQKGKASDMNSVLMQNCIRSVKWKLNGQKPKYEATP